MTAYSWNSATNGAWGTGSLWNPNGVPGAGGGDTALIDASGSSYTVVYDQSSSAINDLTVNSSFATLSFNANTGLTVYGNTKLQAGAIELLNAGASLTAGALTIDAGAFLRIGNGASITYNSITIGGVVTLSGSIALGTNSTSMSLDGMVEVTSGSATIGFSGLSGSGSIEADGGTVLVTGTMANVSVHAVVTGLVTSVFQTTGALYYGSSMFVDFLGAAGEFEYNNPSNIDHVNFSITGMNAGDSAVTPTNFVNLAGVNVTVSSGGSGTGDSGAVTLSNGGVLTLSGITNVGPAWQVQTVSDGAGGTNIFLQSVCYMAGTRILTPDGERAVETLAPGDVVQTLIDGTLVPRVVRWVGSRRINLRTHPRPDTVAPILIRQDAFAAGIPQRDLYVSPAHAILVDGQLVCARLLDNGMTIRQDIDRTVVDYFHVELDTHAILLAEALPAESYLDTGNRGFFANGGAPLVLHPDLTDPADTPVRETASCRPFIWRAADVRPIWSALARRAEALGHELPARTTTPAADLRIEVDGRTLRPLRVQGEQVIFALPPRAARVRLLSRATRPCDLQPWLDDSRRLGVMVRRLRCETADGTIDMPLDHPGLGQGWWDMERDGTAMWRWTDGAAEVALPAGTMLLHVVAAPMQAYVLPAAAATEELRHVA